MRTMSARATLMAERDFFWLLLIPAGPSWDPGGIVVACGRGRVGGRSFCDSLCISAVAAMRRSL